MQQSTGTKGQKSYRGPALKKLTPEHANEFLLHHARMGDQGAKHILDLVLPFANDSKYVKCVSG